jgi:hypothetical protein
MTQEIETLEDGRKLLDTEFLKMQYILCSENDTYLNFTSNYLWSEELESIKKNGFHRGTCFLILEVY